MLGNRQVNVLQNLQNEMQNFICGRRIEELPNISCHLAPRIKGSKNQFSLNLNVVRLKKASFFLVPIHDLD